MIVILMLILFAASLLLLRREGLLRGGLALLISCALLALAFGLRLAMLDHTTLDYESFLSQWVDFFRQNGGVKGLGQSVGNYNIPYLFFLSLFSYLDFNDLYLIKYLSIAFDVALAWGVLKLVSHYTRSQGARLTAFLGTLLLPTVLLNGAYWGQCDSIYTALAVLSFWAALDNRPRLSVALISLSFAFKLQAIFFMPIYLILLVTKRIRWRHLIYAPVAYVAAVLPAVLAGRPFLDTLMLYFRQADSVGDGLNYNSPSLFAFYPGGAFDKAQLARLGIAAAFFFCALLLWWLCAERKRLNDRVLLAAFLLAAIGLPYFLPHMHDRYFFGADVLSFALAVVALPTLPAPFLCSFASLLGYHAYLRQRYLLPMMYGACALAAAMALLLGYMIAELYAPAPAAPAPPAETDGAPRGGGTGENLG